MTVFVLIREDQSEHGYIDTSVTGVFREVRVAKEMDPFERLHAREEGHLVEGRGIPPGLSSMRATILLRRRPPWQRPSRTVDHVNARSS